jgi:hypothetical protein
MIETFSCATVTLLLHIYCFDLTHHQSLSRGFLMGPRFKCLSQGSNPGRRFFQCNPKQGIWCCHQQRSQRFFRRITRSETERSNGADRSCTDKASRAPGCSTVELQPRSTKTHRQVWCTRWSPNSIGSLKTGEQNAASKALVLSQTLARLSSTDAHKKCNRIRAFGDTGPARN